MIDKAISDCIAKASAYKGIARIGVFGSFARQEATEDSDIDILYEYHYIDNDNNGISDMFKFMEVLEADMSEYLGNRKIDFVSYHAIENSDDSDLKQNIMRDVVWIYQQP